MIYEPQEDSFLLFEQVKKHVKSDDSVLEIGTGSGLLADAASKKARSVTAVDINPEAIAHCKKDHKGITFLVSDMFEKVKGKFDLIIFNPPYLPEDEREPEDSALATTGGKQGYELTRRFLEGVNDRLSADGRILLLFSSMTKKKKVEEFISDNLLEFKELATRKIPFETLYVYLIRKSSFLKMLEAKGISSISRLTKGHRGLIYTGMLDKRKVAIKLQRPDVEAKNTVNNEIVRLQKLNKKGIGPRLIDSGKDFFIYYFVEGEFILKALETRTKPKIKKILKGLLEQCFTLDSLGLNKEEMHHPVKHVIIGDKDEVTLLDFERCKPAEKVRNVTQCCQFITSGLMDHVLETRKVCVSKPSLLAAAKKYKSQTSRGRFDDILKLIDAA